MLATRKSAKADAVWNSNRGDTAQLRASLQGTAGDIPEKADLEWLKQGGGFIKNKHASAGRFNPGEKADMGKSTAVHGVEVELRPAGLATQL